MAITKGDGSYFSSDEFIEELSKALDASGYHVRPPRKTKKRKKKEDKWITEAYIEEQFRKFLVSKGVKVHQQISCPVGRADLAIPGSLFEIKTTLNIVSVRIGVAQVISYQKYIDQTAKMYVVGQEYEKHTEKCIQHAKMFGVSLIKYNSETDEFKLMGD